MQKGTTSITPSNLRLLAACTSFSHLTPALNASYSQTGVDGSKSVVWGDVFRISETFEAQGWAYGGVPFPLDGILVQPRISVDQPAVGSASKLRPLGFASAVIATGSGH